MINKLLLSSFLLLLTIFMVACSSTRPDPPCYENHKQQFAKYKDSYKHVSTSYSPITKQCYTAKSNSLIINEVMNESYNDCRNDYNKKTNTKNVWTGSRCTNIGLNEKSIIYKHDNTKSASFSEKLAVAVTVIEGATVIVKNRKKNPKEDTPPRPYNPPKTYAPSPTYTPPTVSSSNDIDAGPFVREDLRTWNPVTTYASIGIVDGQKILGGRIQVCVRDHACEDGDILRVSVLGKSWTKQLFNKWQCRGFRVDGRRRGESITVPVKVTAVNGSGNIGQCSYANANTGQIRVSGYNKNGGISNSQTQGWRLRSKAGSYSTIKVTLE